MATTKAETRYCPKCKGEMIRLVADGIQTHKEIEGYKCIPCQRLWDKSLQVFATLNGVAAKHVTNVRS